MSENQHRDFDAFFRQYQNTVFRIVLGYVRSHDIAEDIAVEAFIRVYDRWEKVQNFKNPVGYLVRIAINIAKKYLIKNKAHRILSIFDLELQSNRRDPEQMLMLNEEDRQLENALLKLKNLERTVIIMKDIDGKKFHQIAEILNLKLSTVKSHYRRGKMKLARKMEDFDEKK